MIMIRALVLSGLSVLYDEQRMVARHHVDAPDRLQHRPLLFERQFDVRADRNVEQALGGAAGVTDRRKVLDVVGDVEGGARREIVPLDDLLVRGPLEYVLAQAARATETRFSYHADHR